MHKQHNQKVITTKKNSGFTLIELLVVISIIGILSSVILASLSGARRSANNAVSIAETRQFQTQLALYFLENGGYPVLSGTTQPGYSFWACVGLQCLNSAAAQQLISSTINNNNVTSAGMNMLSINEQTTTNPNSFLAFFGAERAEAAVGFSQFNLAKRTNPIFYYCSQSASINSKILCPDGNAWVVNPSFSGNTVTYGAVQAGGSQIGTITGYGY